ncbi:hypothetical protein B1748_04245 [Paenibacillus sp. MY03]|nr:hypothetical protein B1748_04245 [Paenibacillus sp. MY03]
MKNHTQWRWNSRFEAHEYEKSYTMSASARGSTGKEERRKEGKKERRKDGNTEGAVPSGTAPSAFA